MLTSGVGWHNSLGHSPATTNGGAPMRVLAVAGFIATAVGAGIEVVLTGLVMPGAIFIAIPLALAALVWLRSDRLSLGLAALVAALFLYGNLSYSVTLVRLQH